MIKCVYTRLYYLFIVVWTPYFPTVLDAWANKNHPNMLFIFYEDMKKVNNYMGIFCFKCFLINTIVHIISGYQEGNPKNSRFLGQDVD